MEKTIHQERTLIHMAMAAKYYVHSILFEKRCPKNADGFTLHLDWRRGYMRTGSMGRLVEINDGPAFGVLLQILDQPFAHGRNPPEPAAYFTSHCVVDAANGANFSRQILV